MCIDAGHDASNNVCNNLSNDVRNVMSNEVCHNVHNSMSNDECKGLTLVYSERTEGLGFTLPISMNTSHDFHFVRTDCF